MITQHVQEETVGGGRRGLLLNSQIKSIKE